ncbi:MAG: hypothetical protein LBQ35_06705 [Spirochaetaceae bacterium]|nr:hypothetical protein [Spirochaetaceae bacterium]
MEDHHKNSRAGAALLGALLVLLDMAGCASPVNSEPPFVAVTGISGVPAESIAGQAIVLEGASVEPAGASARDITWTLKDGGGIGLSVESLAQGAVRPAGTGVLVLTASVPNGKGGGADFSRDYSVAIVEGYTVTANGTHRQTATTELSFTFTGAVGDLTDTDIILSNGTGAAVKGALSGAGANRSLGIRVEAEGTLKVTILRSGIESAVKTVTVYSDGQPYLAEADGSAGTEDTSAITFTFEEPVEDLSAGDIIIVNAGATVSKGALSGAGTVWTLGLTVTNPGAITVAIRKAGVESVVRPLTVYKAGVLAIAAYTAEANGGSTESSTFILFKFGDNAVSGLTAGHIVFGGGSGTVVKGALTDLAGGRTWMLEITVTVAGTNTVSIVKEGVEAEAKALTLYRALHYGAVSIGTGDIVKTATAVAEITAPANVGGAVPLYQWQAGASGTGPFSAIAGATSDTWTVPAEYLGKYIRAEVTFEGFGGALTSAARKCINPPLEGTVSISGGALTVGTTLMATPSLTSPEGDLSYAWRRGNSTGGAFTNLAGETGLSYTLAEADLGKFVRFAVTCSGNSGELTETAGPITWPPYTGKPKITYVGERNPGTLLTADIGGITGSLGTVQYQWLRADDAASLSPGSAIPGATDSTYLLVNDDNDKYVAVLVTYSKNSTAGAEAMSAPLKIGVGFYDFTTSTSAKNVFGTNAINGVTYGGGKFVAVGAAGTIAYSTDGGINWTKATGTGTGILNAVAYGGPQNGEVFVAVGAGSLWSADGITWESVSSSGVRTDVIWGDAAGVFVSVGITSTNTNNATWSADGKSWTTAGGMNTAAGRALNVLAYGSGKFVTLTNGTGNQINHASFYSTDGKTWENHLNNGTVAAPTALAWWKDLFILPRSNGSLLCAEGSSNVASPAWSKTVANTITGYTTGTSITALRGNDTYLVTGTSTGLIRIGTGLNSADEWHAATFEGEEAPSVSQQLNEVACGDGTFVIVGNNGTALFWTPSH